jgi:glycosyltransferase 2 family protein
MLARLLDNRLVRPLLLATALAFCGFGLASDWTNVVAAFGRLHWYSVGGAFIAAVAGCACMVVGWRAVLSDLGSRLPLVSAIRVSFISEVAKYVPGAIWPLAAQVELGRDHQVPARRMLSTYVISLAITLDTGLLIGTIALPLASSAAARHYWWLLALTPLIAIGLLPPVLGRALNLVLRLVRQQPLEQRPSLAGLLVAVGWTSLGWALWGTQAWLLVNDLTGGGAHVMLLGLGSYALAWSAGILVVVFPGGIGPRELAFIAVLAPVMNRNSALVVALMSRVVMTATDLACAGIGITIGKLTRPSVRPRAAEAAPAEAQSAATALLKNTFLFPGQVIIGGHLLAIKTKWVALAHVRQAAE